MELTIFLVVLLFLLILRDIRDNSYGEIVKRQQKAELGQEKLRQASDQMKYEQYLWENNIRY